MGGTKWSTCFFTAVAAMLAFVPAAGAAAPANNNYASAQFLAGSLPLNVKGSNVEATSEGGEPSHTPVLPAGKSAWYSWTAPATKKFVADSCTADYNSVTAVYKEKAAVNELTALEFPPVDRCRTEFSATSGVTYRIAVDGTNSFNIPPANPDGAFTLHIRELNRPANDLFASAQAIAGPLPKSVASTNADALAESEEPKHGGEQLASSSVWFKWTAGFTGPVAIDTCDAEFDTRLAVYTGSSFSDPLSSVASNDDGCFQQSRVTFEASSGTEYKIAVDGFNTVGAAAQGPFTLRIHVPSAPSNDNFASPEALSATVPLSISDSSEDATKEGGEPEHSEINKTGASVWYSWTPAASGPVAIDTCESNFQAAVAVYTGTALGSLAKVVKNIYGCGVAARANFVAAAGTEYRIAVAGVNADQGEVKLRIRKRPANDDFADAQEISGPLPIDAEGSNFNASAQPSEPQHVLGGAGSGSVWFKWKATATGTFFVESCGSAIESSVAVYTGTQVNSLTAKWVFRSNCKRYFQATKDTVYSIAVDGKAGEQGPTDLVLRAASAPPNDNFANAQVLAGSLPVEASGDTVDSSVETGEPEHAGSNANTTVWYEWKPATSGAVRISDCMGSDMIVAVYTGAAVNTLGGTEVGTRLTKCNVRLSANSSTTYRIAVVSAGFEIDSFTLKIRTPSPPANDALANAVSLPAGLPFTPVNGTNVDATKESGEPNHNNNAGSASVWYSWKPSASQPVTIDVCIVPSTFFGMNEVYTAPVANPVPSELVKVGTRKSRCRIKLEAVKDTKYWITVDGFVSSGNGGGAEGTFELGIHSNSPQANDNFSAAQAIVPAVPTTVNGTSVDATAEGGEPSHAGFTPSATVWYSWTPAQSQTVVIEGCASSADAGPGPPTAVYLGSAVNALSEQGDRQGRCRVQLNAVKDDVYKIAIGSIGLIEGGLTLTIRLPSTPANDDFASPKALGASLPINESGTTLDASRESGEPNHASTAGTASVWYSWTPGADEEAELNACSTGASNTLLGVYVGTKLDELEKVGTRAPPGSPFEAGRLCKAVLEAKSGTTYRIAIDRSSGIEGPTQLTIDSAGSPSPPAAPNLTGTSPASPANSNSPKILGTASGEKVILYQSVDCTSMVKEGTPAQLLAGLTVSVADNSTTKFTAKAENSAGPSPCSAPISYTEDSTAPAGPSLTSTSPASGSNDNNPKVIGSAEAGSMVRLYLSSDCTGSPVATGTAAQLASPGLAIAVVDNSTTAVRATATDAAGNASTCSAPISYSEVTPAGGSDGGSGGSSAGGGSSSASSSSGPPPAATPPAKPLKCKKGFKRVKVKGKPKCKKAKKKKR